MKICETCKGFGAVVGACSPVRCDDCSGAGVQRDGRELPPLGIVWTEAGWAAEKPWSHYPMGRAA